MATKLIVIHTTNGPGPANIIQGLLAAAGIPCILSREGAGTVYGLTVGPLGMVDILVPDDRAGEAEAVLAAMQRGDLADSNDADTDDTGGLPGQVDE